MRVGENRSNPPSAKKSVVNFYCTSVTEANNASVSEIIVDNLHGTDDNITQQLNTATVSYVHAMYENPNYSGRHSCVKSWVLVVCTPSRVVKNKNSV